MRRMVFALLLVITAAYGNAAELVAGGAEAFMLLDGRKLMVPCSSLEKTVPLIKRNGPEDIIITFPLDYPIVGDETVPWSKAWYRSELTKLAAGADGWALRSITIREK